MSVRLQEEAAAAKVNLKESVLEAQQNAQRDIDRRIQNTQLAHDEAVAALKGNIMSPRAIRSKDGEESELRTAVTWIHKQVNKEGSIDLGGDVSLLRIDVIRDAMKFEEELRFVIETPEGRTKHFTGPLWSFRECRSAEDFVLRGLGYAEG